MYFTAYAYCVDLCNRALACGIINFTSQQINKWRLALSRLFVVARSRFSAVQRVTGRTYHDWTVSQRPSSSSSSPPVVTYTPGGQADRSRGQIKLSCKPRRGGGCCCCCFKSRADDWMRLTGEILPVAVAGRRCSARHPYCMAFWGSQTMPGNSSLPGSAVMFSPPFFPSFYSLFSSVSETVNEFID